MFLKDNYRTTIHIIMEFGRQKQTLDIVYNMCIQESDKAKESIYKCMEKAKQLYDNFAGKWDSEEFEDCRLNYDNAISDLIVLTDIVQKFNIALTTKTPAICNAITTNIPDECGTITTNIPEKSSGITTNIPERISAITTNIPEKCSAKPRQKTEKVQEKYTYPNARLEKYIPGYEAECILTFIKDADQKLFFITETGNNEYTDRILRMQEYFSENGHAVEEKIPDEGQIFGINLEGYMFRAVRENGIFKDEEKFHIYLLDVGEEILSNKNMEIYSLHADYQVMPAQAILCELKSVINSSVETNLSEYLTSNLYVKHNVFVKNNRSQFLEVGLDGETNPFKRQEFRQNVTDLRKTDPMFLKPISNPFKNYVYIKTRQYSNNEVNQTINLHASNSTAISKSMIEHSIIKKDTPNISKISGNFKLTKEFYRVNEFNGFKNYDLSPKLEDILNDMPGAQIPNLDCTPYQQVPSVNNENKTTVAELTSDKFNILSELPLCTTNAMKAVMGYDARNDKRICKFDDTESCIKGAHCRFEHNAKMKDSCTRDQAPITKNIQNKLAYPNIGESIKLIPTHVTNVEEFFAHIKSLSARYLPNTLKQLTLRMNSSENTSLFRKVETLPVTMELVLALYRDGLFYRARVLRIIDDYTIKVFYVDYGYSGIVPLHNVRKWEHKFSDLPFQAVHCRLSGISEKKSCSPEATDELRYMILNKSISAEVVDNMNQLHVRLFDVDGFEIAEQLIGMELANPKHVYAPVLYKKNHP